MNKTCRINNNYVNFVLHISLLKPSFYLRNQWHDWCDQFELELLQIPLGLDDYSKLLSATNKNSNEVYICVVLAQKHLSHIFFYAMLRYTTFHSIVYSRYML